MRPAPDIPYLLLYIFMLMKGRSVSLNSPKILSRSAVSARSSNLRLQRWRAVERSQTMLTSSPTTLPSLASKTNPHLHLRADRTCCVNLTLT